MTIDSQERYDEMSSSYDKDRVQSYFLYIRRFLSQWVGDPPKNVVEIGSGTGEYSLGLAKLGHKVLGLDVSPEMISLCKTKARTRGQANCDFELANGEQHIPAPWSVDRLLAIDCWECFADPLSLLQSMRQVLAPDGRVLIVTPNNWLFPLFWIAEVLRIKKNRPAFDYHNSYPHRISSLAKKAGFRVVSVKIIFYFTTLAVTLEIDGERE